MTTIFEIPGRTICPECNGDADGTPCPSCGGGGLLPFELPSCPVHVQKELIGGGHAGYTCAFELERIGWHALHAVGANPAPERLPLYRCADEHEVAIRFLPVPERSAA